MFECGSDRFFLEVARKENKKYEHQANRNQDHGPLDAALINGAIFGAKNTRHYAKN
jgi:hypothetical protein